MVDQIENTAIWKTNDDDEEDNETGYRQLMPSILDESKSDQKAGISSSGINITKLWCCNIRQVIEDTLCHDVPMEPMQEFSPFRLIASGVDVKTNFAVL